MNSNFPKISVVTPSFDQGRFLEQTIRSVLDQAYPNLEYIIIDGNSSDNSVEIIKKYESHISYWVSEPDKGQTQAINKGLRKATGDILAYLNSDDVYLPGCFAKISRFFSENKDVGLVYGDCDIIDENGKLIMHRRELDFDYTMGCMIGFGIIISQPSVFFTRETFEKVGYFNEQIQNSMDSEYWFRVAQVATIRHIPVTLSGFRIHGGSKTNSLKSGQNPKFRGEIEAVLKQGYETLGISKIIPYRYSYAFRMLYRLKRFIPRLFRGYHFKMLLLML